MFYKQNWKSRGRGTRRAGSKFDPGTGIGDGEANFSGQGISAGDPVPAQPYLICNNIFPILGKNYVSYSHQKLKRKNFQLANLFNYLKFHYLICDDPGCWIRSDDFDWSNLWIRSRTRSSAKFLDEPNAAQNLRLRQLCRLIISILIGQNIETNWRLRL